MHAVDCTCSYIGYSAGVDKEGRSKHNIKNAIQKIGNHSSYNIIVIATLAELHEVTV